MRGMTRFLLAIVSVALESDGKLSMCVSFAVFFFFFLFLFKVKASCHFFFHSLQGHRSKMGCLMHDSSHCCPEERN